MKIVIANKPAKVVIAPSLSAAAVKAQKPLTPEEKEAQDYKELRAYVKKLRAMAPELATTFPGYKFKFDVDDFVFIVSYGGKEIGFIEEDGDDQWYFEFEGKSGERTPVGKTPADAFKKRYTFTQYYHKG